MGAEFKPKDKNLGNSNQNISDPVRIIKLNGGTSEEKLEFRRSSDNMLLMVLDAEGNLKVGNNNASAISIRNDGVINFGAAGDYGSATWDTNKAIITSLGSKFLELASQVRVRIFGSAFQFYKRTQNQIDAISNKEEADMFWNQIIKRPVFYDGSIVHNVVSHKDVGFQMKVQFASSEISYQNDKLIDAEITMLVIGSIILEDDDFVFDPTTGTITYGFILGITAKIFYTYP